ncbi:amidohydrolase [Aurantiacibacter suaedae]|uniref:amidohydrolase n=1 Tax=Aurantiacibacter suaedae TaxID=2545755 RepID=UPI001F4FA077|nr:amidohydrolase [Aurantiacibacter suaedae]
MLVSTTATPTLAQDAEMAAAIEADWDGHLAALFEHFHRNPELSFMEVQTAARMAAELREAGAEVTENVGGTGVVGMLRNGEGPLVMLRADMDGLPLKEDSGLDYASTVTQVDADGVQYPVMHACGHDSHITALVGIARYLAAHTDEWSGTVMLVVQPAEERLGGARAMLEDGLYDRFGKPDYALAFHSAAGAPVGTINIADSSNLVSSSSDAVDIVVHGVGAHGAYPHAGRDPVYIGAEIVTGLQGIVSREVAPLQPSVITVGMFNAGTKRNIIPDRAELQLTVRSNDPAVRAQLLEAIERVAVGTARAHGIDEDMLPEVTHQYGTPANINNDALARRLDTALRSAFGEDAVVVQKQTGMGAEDFAYFVTEDTGVPGYFIGIGGTPLEDIEAAANGGPPVPSHHSPFFRIDGEATVTLGAQALITAVLNLAAPS